MQVVDEPNVRAEPPLLTDLTVASPPGLTSEEMLDALVELDVGPSARMGMDHAFARKFDCAFVDGEWRSVEPKYVVVVTCERTCFAVHPAMHERIDVEVEYDPAMPLDGGDEEAAYRARWTYREAAYDELRQLGYGLRPGFSSWSASSEVKLAKVTDPRRLAPVATGSAPAP
jgi:hypothetical protein